MPKHANAAHATTKHDPWGTPPWTAGFIPKERPLPHHVDFAIVGGGFAGLSAAAHLKRLAPQKSVLLLEAASLGNGASGRTGGMALDETAAGKLPGLGNVLGGYRRILRNLGIIHINRANRARAGVSFPGVWEIGRGGTALALDAQPKHLKFKKHSAIHWNDSGDLRIVRKVPGGSVDPKKVVAGLARAAEKAGVHIVERAEVIAVDFENPLRLRVRLARSGKRQFTMIYAGQVLFATNAGGLRISGIPRNAQAKLTFAVATGSMKRDDITALGLSDGRPFYTVDLPYLWGRAFGKNRIIFGSGLVPAFGQALRNSRRASKCLWDGLERLDVTRGECADRLRVLEARVRGLHPVLKNVRITHRWGGPILITQDWRPVFRRHPKSARVMILGGFSGHGVALSVYLGRWAAQALLGKRALPDWR